MIKKKHNFVVGSKRIKGKDLKLYEKKKLFWKRIDDVDESIRYVIELYNEKGNLEYLFDDIDVKFLKGVLMPDDKIFGQRVKVLPCGSALARGGFSLFANNLKFNLENSEGSWDVCFENESGGKTYLYSIDKVHLEQEHKYQLTQKFEKYYDKIMSSLKKDIEGFDLDDVGKDDNIVKYLGLYVLLNTFIRVGNLEYFRHNGHKGLTTLQKSDIKIIDKDKGIIIFDFIAKDGVPQKIEKKLDKFFIDKFSFLLDSIDKDDGFIFAIDNIPVHSSDFSKILFDYTGEHFYPHIIRSFYANNECKNFLDDNKGCKLKKNVIDYKFDEIALGLGHKRFNKNNNKWKVNHKVTIDSYIYPKLSEKMINLIE